MSSNPSATIFDALERYRATWDAKPVLQAVYGDFYNRMKEACHPNGPTLEIGAGIGKPSETLPGVITSDIQFAPWLDLSPTHRTYRLPTER